MASVTIIGSGPSGVHFALTLLEKGHRVTMIDVGYERPAPHLPDRHFGEIKTEPTAISYLLGATFNGVVLPSFDTEYYGIPPSKDYVFRNAAEWTPQSKGFAPMFSFAQGGLAEAWTGGCYPFNAAELDAFPFSYDELAPYYGQVAQRIGVTGAADDLAAFMPVHEHLHTPLRLDDHSARLMARYERHRPYLQGRLRCSLGRTRVAVLSHDDGDRAECAYLGRCLWGCPRQSLYTPSQTLEVCRRYDRFTYVGGEWADTFVPNGDGRIHTVRTRHLASGETREHRIDHLVLAAGALSTSAIFLRSVRETTGEIVTLPGLMDNRQILVPFLNLRMIGRPFEPQTYQYHLLGLGIEGAAHPREYVHGQITTLKSAMMHPIIQQVPLNMRAATYVARTVHAALGVVNLNFHDDRRDDNTLSLAPSPDGSWRLAITYRPPPGERSRLRAGVRTTTRALRRLGCIVPPGMVHTRPMGASVHYAGTLPMAGTGPWATDALGRSHAFPNLTIADGASFPFLPAKNITFTLMANAARIADTAF